MTRADFVVAAPWGIANAPISLMDDGTMAGGAASEKPENNRGG